MFVTFPVSKCGPYLKGKSIKNKVKKKEVENVACGKMKSLFSDLDKSFLTERALTSLTAKH